MTKPFEFLMRFMRSKGTTFEASEVRLLWIVITIFYVAITAEIVGGAVMTRLRRNWNQLVGNPTRYVPAHRTYYHVPRSTTAEHHLVRERLPRTIRPMHWLAVPRGSTGSTRATTH